MPVDVAFFKTPVLPPIKPNHILVNLLMSHTKASVPIDASVLAVRTLNVLSADNTSTPKLIVVTFITPKEIQEQKRKEYANANTNKVLLPNGVPRGKSMSSPTIFDGYFVVHKYLEQNRLIQHPRNGLLLHSFH